MSRRSTSAGRYSCPAAPFTGSYDVAGASTATTASTVVAPCRKSYRERVVAFRENHSLSEASVLTKRNRNRLGVSAIKYLDIIIIIIIIIVIIVIIVVVIAVLHILNAIKYLHVIIIIIIIIISSSSSRSSDIIVIITVVITVSLSLHICC